MTVATAIEGEEDCSPIIAGTDPMQGFSDMVAVPSLPFIKDSATLTARAVEPHAS